MRLSTGSEVAKEGAAVFGTSSGIAGFDAYAAVSWY
jgi:hypothetical protein